MGKWKGIRKDIFDGNLEIELYDLTTDLEEQVDLSSQNPEIVEELRAIMKQEHEPAFNKRFKFKQLGDI